MKNCPNCNHDLNDEALSCDQCGHEIVASQSDPSTLRSVGSIDDTIDATDGLGFDDLIEGDDAEESLEVVDLPPVDEELTVTSQGTLIEEPSDETDLEFGTFVSNESAADLSDLRETVQLDVDGNGDGSSPSGIVGDNQATFAVEVNDFDEGEIPADQVKDDSKIGETVEFGSEGALVPSDGDATIVFADSDAAEAAAIDKTVEFGTSATDHATVSVGESGTEGRLHRMWEGAAGSSANPMHSLQAVSMEASEAIFERVAVRKVSDANSPARSDADYQIINKLGEGAMGLVFTARQTAVDRLIAFKTAKPNFQKNDDARRRFLYEAQITADLDHSNIVPIHELGLSEDGMLFYSMKLVEGDQWSRVLPTKTREENLDIFMKVADAVAFAHSKGIVHRDLKPENTMLGRFGEVFVTDWGTAVNFRKETTKLAETCKMHETKIVVTENKSFRVGDKIVILDGEEVHERNEIRRIEGNTFSLRKKLTRDYLDLKNLKVIKAVNMAGTPCYMAPEMASHNLSQLGRTSDIYVLGAMLYEIVTNRPPHTGSTVTQCLRAAMENELVETDSSEEDALLQIAFVAMKSDPADRYKNVEELQNAVRLYRRHAESIALTKRSDELLQRANETGDYETYSRSMFGYRDAIDLWPEHQAARTGLAEARLAFGKEAFRKRDYDLVLQTVDQSVPAEETLYQQALAAKKSNENREARLRLLQRTIAAVVLFAVVGLSALSLFAFVQRSRAIQTATENIALAEQEKLAKEAAVASKMLAEEKKKEADISAEIARQAAAEANEANRQTGLALMAANEAKRLEEEAKKIAIAEKDAADMARAAESEAKDIAVKAKDLAERRAVQIQLDDYKASLALAKSQIESYDIGAGRQTLTRLQNLTSDLFSGRMPNLQTWGWQRINLLSNADLPKAELTGNPVGTSIASATNRIAIATDNGGIEVFELGAGGFTKLDQLVEPEAVISTVAIAPNGDAIAFSYVRNEISKLAYWKLGDKVASDVVSAENRNFQHLAFSADGTKLVGGINNGMWIWSIGDRWLEQQASVKRIDKVRGQLIGIQAIDNNQYLLTVDFQNNRSLRWMDVRNGTAEPVELPSGLDGLLSCAAVLPNNQLAVALTDNRLLVGALDASHSKVNDAVELEKRHRAAVTSIAIDGKNQMVTASIAEPAAHVWSFENGQWRYKTPLAATADNLVSVAFAVDGQVVGVDKQATTVAWSIDRQLQRNRLQRVDQEEKPTNYFAPVEYVAANNFDGSALAIDRNGVVDLFSLVDGKSQRFDEERWSYIGHTPGAVLVDSAVDTEQGMLVTAADLKSADRRYLSDNEQDWEFCVWDLRSGEMLRRWSAANFKADTDSEPELIEQRISLIDRGRSILFASDSQTRIASIASGQEVLRKTDFGTYFAVPNPKNPSMVMLVKRSGAVRLLDVADLSSWDRPENRDFRLANASEVPLKGVWSEDGKHFYMAFNSGGLAVWELSSSGLNLRWSSRSLESINSESKLVERLSSPTNRTSSHLNIDLIVQQSDRFDTLHVAVRNRSSEPTTTQLVLKFSRDDFKPELVKDETTQDIRWLRNTGGSQPQFTADLHDVLFVDSQNVSDLHRMRDQTFVVSKAARAYRLVDGKVSFDSFGRSALRSASGARDSKTVYAQLADDSLWRFTYTQDAGPKWERLEYSKPGTRELKLSPDGSQLLLIGEQNATLVNTLSGQTLHEFDSCLGAGWDPQHETRLAVCASDGVLLLYHDGEMQTLKNKVATGGDRKVVDVQFFNESWSGGESEIRQHLIILTEASDSAEVSFVAIDELPKDLQIVERESVPQLSVAKGSKLVASPNEDIFVTGSPSGTVTAWFCSPTWAAPNQLFDLEGHRGAAITCVAFTADGKTLITADEKNRLYAWMSSDPKK